MLKEKLLGIVMTQKMADARYVLKEEPGPGPTPTPTLTSVEWRNASVTPPTVPVGGTATIGGTVWAHYSDDNEVNVTAMATFSAQHGTIDGTTYQATEAGTDVIGVSYNEVAAVTRITVQVGTPVTASKVYYGFEDSALDNTTTLEGDDLATLEFQDVEGACTISNNNVANLDTGNWFFVFVPARFAVTSATMGGIDFGLTFTENVTIDGESYKKYKATGDDDEGYQAKDDCIIVITIA